MIAFVLVVVFASLFALAGLVWLVGGRIAGGYTPMPHDVSAREEDDV